MVPSTVTIPVGQTSSTFTATAILPQMQGAMAATQDEISWTVTFNILATAVCTPMTGWLVGRFGRGPVQFDAKGDRKDAEITIFRLRGGRIVPIAIVRRGEIVAFQLKTGS